MDEPDDLGGQAVDAALALIALGGGLKWERNWTLLEVEGGEGEVAYAERGVYDIRYCSFLRDTWSNLSGAPMVDVTFYEHSDRYVRRMHIAPAPFRNEASAKAACEYHRATGKWEYRREAR